MKKIIFYNLTTFVVFYSLIEILSGTLLFNKIDCHYLLCKKEFEFENNFGFYKDKKSFYRRDEYGFRLKEN